MLNVGIIGYGSIVRKYLADNFFCNKNFKIYAISTTNRDFDNEILNKYHCKIFYSYLDVINSDDIDIVYIALPNAMHYNWAKLALISGKHVLCEKPLSICYRDVESLVNIANKNNLLLMESFQFQFHEQNLFVKDLLREYSFNDIRQLDVKFGFPPLNKDNIRYNKSLGGGALYDAGVYTIKAMTYLFPNTSYDLIFGILKENDLVDIVGNISFKVANSFVANLGFGFDNSYACGYSIWTKDSIISTKRAFTSPPHFDAVVSIDKSGIGDNIVIKNCNHFQLLLDYIYKLILSCDFGYEYKNNLLQASLLELVVNNSLRVKY